MSLGELGVWGAPGTLSNHLVSWGLLLVLPGNEGGDEERGNWPSSLPTSQLYSSGPSLGPALG